MSIKLYEITATLAAIWANAEAILADETLSDDARAVALASLEQCLKQTEGTHAAKCLDVACLVKSLESEAEAIGAEEAKLKARRQRAERNAEWLRAYLAGNMEPGTNLKDARAVIGWRKSEAVIVDVKPENLPPAFRRTKTEYSADKAAIKEALNTGQTVEGCKVETRFNIQIK